MKKLSLIICLTFLSVGCHAAGGPSSSAQQLNAKLDPNSSRASQVLGPAQLGFVSRTPGQLPLCASELSGEAKLSWVPEFEFSLY